MSPYSVSPPPSLSRRRLIGRVGLAVTGLGLTPLLQACGGDKVQDSGNDEPVVEMNDDLQFVPDRLTIRAGQTVTWRNVGAMVHTATSDPTLAQDATHGKVPTGAASWDSGLIRQGESWGYTFDVAGEYLYFCIPHEAGGMLASLTVEE